jgi:hypothetical protein
MLQQQPTLVNNFFTKVTPEIIKAILASDALYIAVATTAPSIATPSMALGNNTVLPSGETVAHYRRTHECGVNTVPRIRAMVIRGIANIDFDLCTPLDVGQLHFAISGKRVVIADSSEYLGYLAATGKPLPEQIFDLAVLTRIVFPQATLGLNVRAVYSEEHAAQLRRHPCSLRSLAMAHDIEPPVSTYPSGRFWSIGHLSEEHASALRSAAECLFWTFHCVTASSDIGEALDNMNDADGFEEYFDSYMPALRRLAQMHAHGLPVSKDRLEEIRERADSELPGLAQDLLQEIPALEPLVSALHSRSEHASAEVRQIIGGYAATKGEGLPCDDKGLPKIGHDAVMLAGHGETPGLMAWVALEACKRADAGAADLKSHSRRDHPEGMRAHPITAITAATGRTSCRDINAQGMDAVTKSAIQARPGHVLMEADFGAIEIRITAALCVHAMELAQRILDGEVAVQPMVLAGLRDGLAEQEIPRPGFGAPFAHSLAYWYQQALRQDMPLVRLLRRGLCPHDYTSIGMAIQQGRLQLPAGMDRADFMEAQESGAIKRTFGDLRPAAKVMNFGLIYRMSPLGLYKKGVKDGVQWSQEQAKTAHGGWFDQFPEVAFYMLLQLQVAVVSEEPQQLRIPNRYEAGSSVVDATLLASKTLGGREIICFDDRLFNYRSQGTGANILMRMLATLPDAAARHLAMVVHDSALFEVPDSSLEEVKSLAVNTMLRAARHYLDPYQIPVTVDVKVGRNWAEVR